MCQVPLMAALPSARAAMDAYRGVAAVAEHGLRLLRNLARTDANMVRWTQCRLCGLSLVYLFAYLLACVTRASCDGDWLCAGAAGGVAALSPSSYGCPPRRGGRGGARAALLA